MFHSPEKSWMRIHKIQGKCVEKRSGDEEVGDGPVSENS